MGTTFYSVFKWRFVADMLQYMPYDALALGNSEFVDGLDGLIPFLRAIGPLFVCTNIRFDKIANASLRQEMRHYCPTYKIIQYKAKQVCILGYTTPVTAYISQVSYVTFEDEVTALTREIRKRRTDGLKIFVALGHSGYERDLEIAHMVPSLDIIIGAHSHTLLWPNKRDPFKPGTPRDRTDKIRAKGIYPTVVVQASGRKVLVTQMLKHGKYLGVLDVIFNDDDEVDDVFPEVYLFIEPQLQADPTKDLDYNAKPADKEDNATAAAFHNYTEMLVPKLNEIIGSTLVDLIGNFDMCYSGECNIGSMIADAMVWSLQKHHAYGTPRTVVAMFNSGSIKYNIRKGNITLASILTVIPYQNTIDVVEIYGSALRKALENSVAKELGKSGRFLQISGIRVVYDMAKPLGQRVVSLFVAAESSGGTPRFEPVVPHKPYRVAMTTFIAAGNDGYTMLAKDEISVTRRHELDLDIVIGYVQQMSPLYARKDGRIQFVDHAPRNDISMSNRLHQRQWNVLGGMYLSVMVFRLC
ncbi:snake venom 5'-nucleotidase-like isoform X1 [Pollicipes pollicipes]|uniref:snake venom 5'-nucleotidase-like isoform X1 n=2 Tax=Pollicipes pollicipes TaxID=41117 RepID=UPI0018857FB3|nr:snake venom 5'-nucleotidase-like isoform X1 [Pollicipes pollicipes]